jgi:hypothetical protein
MPDLKERDRWLVRARCWLTLFVAGLVLSGLTGSWKETQATTG